MVFAVALAAFAGAVCRYLVDVAVQRRATGVLPLGTLVVNTTGSFVLGFLAGLDLHHGLTDTPNVVIGTGLVGAYTTFSTFGYETVRLIEDGSHREAILNVVASVALGIAAAAFGIALAAAL